MSGRARWGLKGGCTDKLRLAQQPGQQRDKGHADQGNAAARDQLFYVFYEKIFARNEP